MSTHIGDCFTIILGSLLRKLVTKIAKESSVLFFCEGLCKVSTPQLKNLFFYLKRRGRKDKRAKRGRGTSFFLLVRTSKQKNTKKQKNKKRRLYPPRFFNCQCFFGRPEKWESTSATSLVALLGACAYRMPVSESFFSLF